MRGVQGGKKINPVVHSSAPCFLRVCGTSVFCVLKPYFAPLCAAGALLLLTTTIYSPYLFQFICMFLCMCLQGSAIGFDGRMRTGFAAFPDACRKSCMCMLQWRQQRPGVSATPPSITPIRHFLVEFYLFFVSFFFFKSTGSCYAPRAYASWNRQEACRSATSILTLYGPQAQLILLFYRVFYLCCS